MTRKGSCHICSGALWHNLRDSSCNKPVWHEASRGQLDQQYLPFSLPSSAIGLVYLGHRACDRVRQLRSENRNAHVCNLVAHTCATQWQLRQCTRVSSVNEWRVCLWLSNEWCERTSSEQALFPLAKQWMERKSVKHSPLHAKKWVDANKVCNGALLDLIQEIVVLDLALTWDSGRGSGPSVRFWDATRASDFKSNLLAMWTRSNSNHCDFSCKTLVAPYCAILRDYLSDTPLLRAMGVLVSQYGQLGAIPPPPFLSVSPLESIRKVEVRYPPLKRGVSAILARYPMKTRQMGAISAILSQKGIARYGGVSRTGPLRLRFLPIFSTVLLLIAISLAFCDCKSRDDAAIRNSCAYNFAVLASKLRLAFRTWAERSKQVKMALSLWFYGSRVCWWRPCFPSALPQSTYTLQPPAVYEHKLPRRPLKTTFDMTTLIFGAGGMPLVPF